MTNILTIPLCGPTQSWGEKSRWEIRDTALIPTKSGIIGLLAAARGLQRGDPAIAEMGRKLHVAVRVEKPGVLDYDYQTVSAWNGKSIGGKILTADGSMKPITTIETPKYYLQDAEFTAFLWGDNDLVQTCADALDDPVWPLYLGRKCCIPSKIIRPTILTDTCIDEAVRTGLSHPCEVEIEMTPGDTAAYDERVYMRQDNVIDASRQKYAYRRVRACVIVPVVSEQEAENATL